VCADVVACFVHKIPAFIKLDEAVRKLVNAGTGMKTQRLMNLEVKKSNMGEVLGLRWQLFRSYLRSFLPFPDEIQSAGVELTMSEPPLSSTSPPADRQVFSVEAGGDDDHHHDHGHAGVMVGGVVYAQSGAGDNGTRGDAPAEPSPSSAPDGLSASPVGQAAPREEEAKEEEEEEEGEARQGESTADVVDITDAGRGFASNAFAVSGRKTKDGSTILAINSHQPWAGPFSWCVLPLSSGETTRPDASVLSFA
jgi:hypothetical protein